VMVRLIDAVGINLEIVLVMSETDNTMISLRPCLNRLWLFDLSGLPPFSAGIVAFPRQQCT